MKPKGDSHFQDPGEMFRYLARNTDPEPSHEAAEAIVHSGSLSWMREQLVKMVNEYPGKTASELQEKFEYLGNHGHLWKRVKQCVDAGLIRKGEVRECKVTDHDAATLWPVEK